MDNYIVLPKNPKTKKELPNQVIIGLYLEKAHATSYYANLPEVTIPEKNMKYLNVIKPFYSGMFNNGAVFLGDKEKISNGDITWIVRLFGAFVRFRGGKDKDNSPFSKLASSIYCRCC